MDRQRLQHHCIDETENRGICSNPEPKRQNRRCGEARICTERSNGVPYILNESVEHSSSMSPLAWVVRVSLVRQRKHPRHGDFSGGEVAEAVCALCETGLKSLLAAVPS